MSKCEACGGDGLIEVGAYRGVEDDPNTRECRLCGGTVTVQTVGAHLDQLAQRAGHADFSSMLDAKASTPSASLIAQLGANAERAVQTLKALGRTGITLKESTSGARRVATVVESKPNWTAHEESCRCSPCAQFWAKRTADEWNEKLRQENEQRQRESESDIEYRGLLSTKPTDAVMNKFLRDRWKE